MASHDCDDTRRADILRRAKIGLEEDLDDLRAELTRVLPDYEQRLRRQTDALPGWLKIPATRLRRLFHLDAITPRAAAASDAPEGPSTTETASIHGILGPRTVALAAGHIEAFIEDWFEPPSGQTPWDTPHKREALADAYDDTAYYLSALLREARRVARNAAETMDLWLDAVLGELDRQREDDVDALEELVRQGDVRRGNRARQEIADLWEDQRRQAADLQVHWAPITALIDEGLSATEEGIKELAGLLCRAREGLIGANDSLSDLLSPFELPQAPAPSRTFAPEPEPMAPTLPPSRTADTSAEEASPGDAPTPDPPAAQISAEDPLDTAGPGDTLLTDSAGETDPGAVSREPGELAESADEDSFNTIPDASYTPGIIPLDEPSSEPDFEGLESGSVSDYSEPAVEPPAVDAVEIPTQRMYTRGETPIAGRPAAPSPAAPQPAGRIAPARPANQRANKPAQPSENPALELGEATYTTCFRIRLGYKSVGLAEIIGVLLPPALLFGVMATLSVLHLAGAEAGFNPFERWPWAISAIAVAAAWLFLLPAGLRWRTKWRGTKLIILRHTDVRDQAELIFDARALRLGAQTWRWDALTVAELRRWDSPPEGVCGWALSLSAPDAPLLRLAAPEPNRKKWQNAPYQLDDIPYQAWQLDTFDFDTICRKAL